MIHTFMHDGHYILIDVESGAVHEVDELVYEMAQIWQNFGREEAIARMCSLGTHPENELKEALAELDALKEQGEFDAPLLPYVPFAGETVVKAICLHLAHDCNLRCAYCFADAGEYHSERALMPLAVGQKALDFLMKHSGNRRHLEVDFFGGEPLMNSDVLKQLVAYGRELEKKYQKEIAFTMTTNCLLVNEEVVDFCRREIHNVVLSVDGRREVHDAVRKTVNGKNSYDIVMNGAKALGLARQREGQEYYVRGTFTRNNLDFCEDVLALHKEGFEQISIEPVVLESGPLAINQSDLPQIFAQYDQLAKTLQKHAEQGEWVNFFHFMIDLDNGPCLSKRMSGCGAGSEYVAVSPQGDIYPCHQFVGNDAFRMGSVMTDECSEEIQTKFRSCNVTNKTKCAGCWAKYYCSGGCAANAEKFNHDISQPYELACEMEKKRLECAIGLVVQNQTYSA